MRGTPEPDLSGRQRTAKPRRTPDRAPAGRSFGEVLQPPASSYRPGSQARAVFAAAYPNNDLHRGGTYLDVQHSLDGEWHTVATDSDWSTKFAWSAAKPAGQTATITWDVPDSMPAGQYRIRYHGHTADGTPFTGTSPTFTVS